MIDIQNEMDTRGIPLECVGISDFKMPIIINGQNTLCKIKLGVNLDELHKGIHMSRLCILLNSISVIDNSTIERITNDACKCMGADSSRLCLSTSIYLEKKAPVSQMPSKLFYDIFIEAKKDKDSFLIKHSISIPITTLCPCSKAISEYGAHNQRGIAKITLQDIDVSDYGSIISIIENTAVSCELFEVIKRPDEKSVTERAYEQPKFVEDVVRDTIINMKDDYCNQLVSVEVISNESIHNHNAFAFTSFNK